MKNHGSARAIRNMLDRPGIHTREEWQARSGTFFARNSDGEAIMDVAIEKTSDGQIRCTVTDHERLRRRKPAVTTFAHRDRDVSDINIDDRRAMSASSLFISTMVAKHERLPEPDTDALADGIRNLIASDPDGAAERIARAIGETVDAATASLISDSLLNEPSYG
jgi:hypothetical protein